MRVKVVFKGPISTITGRSLELDLNSDARIRDLIELIREKYFRVGEERGLSAVFRDFTAHNLILVNGRELSALSGVETKLRDGDLIQVVNFTHGG